MDTKIFNTQRAVTLKVGKPELRFMYSAHPLMVFNVCVKFHENMSGGFKVIKQTRKLLTDIKRAITTKIRKPRVRILVFCMSSYGV